MTNPAILIVEDEAIIRADIANKLRKLGYEIAGSTNTGEEAVEIACRKRPALVLMDIRLPGAMNGIEAAALIKRKCQLPVIFLTAHFDKATVRKARLAEPFGYIQKPFLENELRTQIEMALFKHAAEQRLLENQSRLETFTVATFEGIVEIMSGNIVDCNEQFTHLIGYPRSELIGTGIDKVLAPEDIDRKMANIHQGLDSVAEYDMVRKDGTRIHVEAHGRPMLHGRRIVAIRDITQRKKMEAELLQWEYQRQQLQKAESLGKMAAAIAHRYNNLMAAVLGNLELAMEYTPWGSNISENLIAATNAAREAAEISGMMMTYLGQTQTKLELIDLSEICIYSMEKIGAELPMEIIMNARSDSKGPMIKANSSQIRQILSNLTTNAVEAAGKSGGRIFFNIKTVPAAQIPETHRFPLDWQPKSEMYACLEMRDFGCGIPPEYIDKIFDPFFSTKFTGRGLGLPVTLGIVRMHGGAVTVESKPDNGSLFSIFFPISEEAVPDFKPKKTIDALSVVMGDKILLVEDEEQVRQMARLMLTRLGYGVIEAKDGAEGVEIFQTHRADIRCVLSDLTMPRMNGWEMLAALRKISPAVPVILSSGYNEDQVMAKAKLYLPDAFLGKPYRIKDLDETIRQVLAKANDR